MDLPINERFLEQVIIKANPDIDDEALDMFVEDAQPVLYDRVMTNIATKLNDTQMGELADLMQSQTDVNALYAYLIKAIPNYEEYIATVYDAFEKKYLEEYALIQKTFKKDNKKQKTFKKDNEK